MLSPADFPAGMPSDGEVLALSDGLKSSRRSDLQSGAWFDTAATDTASDVIDRGWKAGPERDRVSLDLPIQWDDLCAADRSWGSQLHSWKFMDVPLREFIRTRDDTLLQWCVERALSWSGRYTDLPTDSDIVWYNMALGQRALRLASLLHLTANFGTSTAPLAELMKAANRHGRELLLEKSFNPRTNHGYFVAIGQTVLGTALDFLPAMRELAGQGRERLALMAKTQFLPDGGHSEHSPEYHRMLMRSFELAADYGWVSDPELNERLRKAADLLGWMIQPNGRLVPLGDTPLVDMTDGSHPPTASPATNFLMSVGDDRHPAAEPLGVFPDSGYAFVRSPQPRTAGERPTSSYLAFTAGFHGRAHKHADDLHFTWYDLGLEILVDGGRFGYGPLLPMDSPRRADGYYYADPFRQFVESTMAHNTVSADGRNHDRRRAPTGSGLGRCEVAGGVFTLRGSARHDGWTHFRTIRLAPGRELTVTDDVQSTDAAKRDFRVWFNFNGRLELQSYDAGTVKLSLPESLGSLEVNELTKASLVAPVRGSESPLRGWRSPSDGKREEVWSLGLEVERTRHHVFQTTLSLLSG